MNDIRTTATPFQKCEIIQFILCTFLNIFALYVTCYKTANMRRPDMSLYHVSTVIEQYRISFPWAKRN